MPTTGAADSPQGNEGQGGVNVEEVQKAFAAGCVTLGRDWAMDIIGLPHNAVRRELRGLYCIAYKLASEQGSGSVGELGKAKEWFGWLEEFIESVFALQEEHLFGWLATGNAALPESMSPTRRAVRQGRARAMCAVVSEALTTGEGFKPAVDRLANVILSFFAAVESTIPQLMRAKFDESAKGQVVHSYATGLAASTPEMFMLLARGFDDDDLQKRFIAAYGPARTSSSSEGGGFHDRIDSFESQRIAGVYGIVTGTRT